MGNIYNVPGSQGVSGDMNEVESESARPQPEEKFVDLVVSDIIEALGVGYNDARIVRPLLRKVLEKKLNNRYKDQGYLQQYEAYVLEESSKELRKALEIPDDVVIDHNHVTWAKFSNWCKYIKAENKKEWLEHFRRKNK